MSNSNMSYLRVPVRRVDVDAHHVLGPCEWWRHTLGDGGINNLPLPDRVIAGARKLQPKLIRVFIQEHFNLYPEHGHYNWTLLDPYMKSIAGTGAEIVASINVKPKVLFPVIDHTIWQPNNELEWQDLIRALVHRYSVEFPYVTYWEIGNETDIGETGGAPFLIKDPDDYLAFYQLALSPILDVFPRAKVGGAASCWIDNEPLIGFIERCREQNVRLDFISWHRYSSNPEQHVLGIQKARAYLDHFASPPEMLYTEWSTNFPAVHDALDQHISGKAQLVSVQDMAADTFRSASVAASIIRMLEAGIDWTFYYHLWDQCFYPEQFRPWYSETGIQIMYEHWNEMPHRFGLFGVDGEVRPQYFVYLMLTYLQAQRVASKSEDPQLYALATSGPGGLSILVVNFEINSAEDRIAQLCLSMPCPGEKTLTTYRIDETSAWSASTLELKAVEQRTVVTMSEFRFQVFLPGNSVALLTLTDKT